MNDTLKEAGRIGAELGAAKAENEKLRGLLREAFDSLCDGLEDGPQEAQWSLRDRALAFRIKDALAQQAEPTDAFTAVDMATAAAQGFRDGQAAVEQAPAQDELPAGGVTIEKDVFGTVHIKMGDFDYIQIQYQYPYTDNASQNVLAKRIAELLTRPAQTEQPEQSGLVEATLPAVRAAERLSSAIIHRMTDRQYQKVRAEFGDLQDALVVCRAALSAQGGDA